MPNKSDSSSGRGKTAQSGGRECCMCGDYGLPNHLFTCNVCHFRSQHRYCSNLYPRAESYRVCNWCLPLHQNDGNDRGGSESAPSDSPANQESNPGDRGGWGTSGRSLPVKKPQQTRARSPAPVEGPPPVAARKRAAVGKPKDDEKVIRRTRSEEVMAYNGGRGGGGGGGGGGHGSSNSKGPCRNKVKRYKLLDEVSA